MSDVSTDSAVFPTICSLYGVLLYPLPLFLFLYLYLFDTFKKLSKVICSLNDIVFSNYHSEEIIYNIFTKGVTYLYATAVSKTNFSEKKKTLSKVVELFLNCMKKIMKY